MLTEVVAKSLVGRASVLLGVWHPLASLLAVVVACKAFAWLLEVAALWGAVRAKQRVREKLFCYAKVGPELQEMADEGLVLAARAKARLGQTLFCRPARRGTPADRGRGQLEANRNAPVVKRRTPGGGGLLATCIHGQRFRRPYASWVSLTVSISADAHMRPIYGEYARRV